MSTLAPSVNPQTLNSILNEPSRPFGSDFAPRSRVYLFYLPFALTFSGAGIWLVPANGTFVLGAVLGTLVGLYILLDVVFRGAPLRFSTLSAMTQLLGYNLGALNSWLTVPRAGLTLPEFLARDPAPLARALAACMASAALLLALGQLYERPLFGREFSLRFERGAVTVVFLSTALLLIGYATGQLGFMGVNVDVYGHTNPLTAIIMWWSVPAFAYSVCATFNTVGPTRWAVGACTLLEGLAMVPFGRRYFAFSLLLAMLGIRLGRYRARLSLLKKTLIGIVVLALVFTASIAFLYLRVAGYGQKGTTSFGTRIGLAVETVHRLSPFEVVQLLGANASTRTFMVGFLSDLLEASRHSAPLLGQDILYNLQLTVPSSISAGKFGLEPYDEELLVDIHWGFGYTDEANSILTAGAADFGLLGILIYPLLFVLFLRVMLEVVQSAMPTFVAVILSLAFTFETLQAENVPVSYFLQVRNTLIVAAIFYIYVRLPRLRLRPAP